jgi:hypothetical protein
MSAFGGKADMPIALMNIRFRGNSIGHSEISAHDSKQTCRLALRKFIVP